MISHHANIAVYLDPLIPPFYMVKLGLTGVYILAHLSRRLIGELIGYSWSGVRPSSVRPSSFTMLKDLLRNRFANQSQILCGASLGRGNDILFAASGSMTKIATTPIYGKNPSKIFISRTGVERPITFHETWYVASGTPAHHSLFK